MRLLAGLALSGVMVVGATGLSAVRDVHARRGGPGSSDAASQTQVARVSRELSDADPQTLSRAFRAAARRSLPGVVYVQVEQAATAPTGRRNPTRDPNQPRQGSGSGFIFRPDGYILTNNHVIDGALRVTVVLPDRREFSAEVVGRDPNTDVAVIRIDADELPVVPIGDSDDIDVGDWVVALGYPLSLGSTATAGIISAKGRTLNILGNEEARTPLEHFLQTDAAINPGNSGGPLVDLEGRAVGINSAIASPTGFFNGYGFAVPINLAFRVAEDLIRYGEPHRPRLGVTIASVDPVDAEVYKLPSVSGAEITGVSPGLPADRAGLQMGDVIVGVEGRAVESDGQLMERLALYAPGQKVQLSVIRYGRSLEFAVELGEFEPAARAASNVRAQPRTGVARLGFEATDLTPQIAEALGFTPQTGVVVTSVDPTSGAFASRLRRGHLIDRINGTQVRSMADLERLAAGMEAGDIISMVARTPDPDSRQGLPTVFNFRVRG